LFLGLKLPRGDADALEEPIPDNPPDGSQTEIDSWFSKKHAVALPRVMSYITENLAGLYQDEEAFAAFVHYALSNTIRKSSWRLGRNKTFVSQLFTKYDEALALLILENNCVGITDIVEGVAADKKTIKTKYTCRGFKKSDGGRGWTEEGMIRFSELTEIVESSRSHGLRADIERRIKESYLVKRKGDVSDGDDDDGEEAGMTGGRVRRARVFVCTGIPI
jgi:hypothetical protein